VISLRYHVVTIVAVFLALAVGLLAGSAFVQPRLVDALRRQNDAQVGRIRALEDQRTELQSEVLDLNGFTDASLPWLTQGRLISTRVVVLAQEGVPDAVVGEAQRALVGAGATVVATLSARAKLASADPADREQLAAILGRGATGGGDLTRIVVAAIADRLARPERQLPSVRDVLHDLLAAGYLTPLGSQITDVTLEQIGGTTESVVILAGAAGGERSPMSPQRFAVPLATELERLGVPVAAGQSTATEEPFVDTLRDQAGDGIVTVDDLDETIGGAALVLGLQRMLTDGRGGAYGVADGAELLPAPS
jgi:hypothetical protein